MKRKAKKDKGKDYVPLWWIILIFLVSFGVGASVDEDDAFSRYFEQRRVRKAKKQNHHE